MGFVGLSLYPMAMMTMILVKHTWTSVTNLVSGRGFESTYSRWEARAAQAQDSGVYLEFTVRSAYLPEDVSILRQSATLAAEIRASLPVVRYGEVANKFADGDDAQCSVCLYSFTREDSVRQAPYCSHVFHKDCLDRWMAHHHVTCPLCRSTLAPKDRPGQCLPKSMAHHA